MAEYASALRAPRPATAIVIARREDRWEHDAHRAAGAVSARPSRVAALPERPYMQPLVGSVDGEAVAAPPSVGRVLDVRGTPLEGGVREHFEQRLGHDFSRVRVHAGPEAAQSARDVGARAYTVGEDIVFGAGQYRPDTPAGRRVLAHELAHVIQQDGTRGQAVPRLQRLDLSDFFEKGAEITLGPAGAALVRSEKQFIDDAVSSVRESPDHVMEFFKTEVWEQIRAHWPQIILVTGGLFAAEAVVAGLTAAPDPTLLTKVIAAIGQIVILAILGYLAGVELYGAYEEGSRWLTLAQEAKGRAAVISEASRAFVRMVWHIVMAVLAIAGVRARIRGLAGAGEAAGAGTARVGAEGRKVVPSSDQPQFQPSAEPAPIRPSGSSPSPGGTGQKLAAPSTEAALQGQGLSQAELARIDEAFQEYTGPQTRAAKTRLRRPASNAASTSARTRFDALRPGYAQRLGVQSGGQVHHAIELQALDRYPGVFTEAELNGFNNMRGIPAEQGGLRQLHNSKVRETWDRTYGELDNEIAARKLAPGTSQYNRFVRSYMENARDAIDYVLGQFFSEYRTGRPRAFR